jgi:hypothetical protein
MISKKILKLFPPPQFLNTSYAGLSMSDKHIRTIQLELDGKGALRIKKYAELPLPVGAITAGRVNNKEQIVAVLTELKKKTGIEYVRVSIPEEKAYLFEIDIPFVEPKDVKSAIEFKIEENVPWPADKVVFDYVVMEQRKSQDTMTAVVSALPSKFVDIYMDLFSSSGLIPYVFEIESQAIARALISPDDTSVYLIAHFHKDKVGLCIVSNGLVHFTSTLNPTEYWHENPTFVATEIHKVITYWQTNHSTPESKNMVSKVFVSGDVIDDSIVSLLSSSLGIEAVLGNAWKNVLDVNKDLPEIPFLESLKYSPAIGLALPSDSFI